VAITIARPITFAEFEQLPEPKGAYHELRHGEVVEAPFAKHGHLKNQHKLTRLLEPAARDTGRMEVAYRPTPEYEGWRADIAYVVSSERCYGTPLDGYLQGAPELEIEVLSPSNTIPEIREKRRLCLANGSREFWVVDSDSREVEVWTPGGGAITYRSGQEIPLFFAPDVTLRVDEIFA
jgi:Uma2 family endonuclease